MQFVRINSYVGKDELISTVKNSAAVNEGVRFDETKGKPVMKVKEKGKRVYMTCEMVGGASRDNGFIIGTILLGRIKEKEGATTLSGVILTAPLYHLVMLALIGYFIYQCIAVGGFSIIPVCIALFGFLIMKDEYKKQGIMKRYLLRAQRRAEALKK